MLELLGECPPIGGRIFLMPGGKYRQAEMITDEVLLERSLDGDEAAFRLLYYKYRDPLYRMAYRMTGLHSTAEDIVHDTFVALLDRPTAYDPVRGCLRNYLYGITRNQTLKRLRVDAEVELPEELEAADATVEGLLAREVSEHVQKAIAALPPQQREVLILCEYEQVPLADIATIVEADVGAVKARLHRARARLRRYFASSPLKP